jgi:hypothetical protein
MTNDFQTADSKRRSRLLAPLLIACGAVVAAGTIALLGNSHGSGSALTASAPSAPSGVVAPATAPSPEPARAPSRPAPPRFTTMAEKTDPEPVLASSEPQEGPAPRHPLQAAPPPVELSAAEFEALKARMAESARRNAAASTATEPAVPPAATP